MTGSTYCYPIYVLQKVNGMMFMRTLSMIETDGVVHEFLAGDKKHLRIKEIDATLDEIAKRLKKEGYAADTDEVSSDIERREGNRSFQA
ncbi:hypothetical protein EV2_010539 [Malus domestica]|uniref:Uncharacterized protein n=1 Tax=Malus domestica TaxID=3750 RepID=A0A498IIZ2_MALDO|nr:hypothetical protein DVH24_036485 [Malus domestica]